MMPERPGENEAAALLTRAIERAMGEGKTPICDLGGIATAAETMAAACATLESIWSRPGWR